MIYNCAQKNITYSTLDQKQVGRAPPRSTWTTAWWTTRASSRSTSRWFSSSGSSPSSSPPSPSPPSLPSSTTGSRSGLMLRSLSVRPGPFRKPILKKKHLSLEIGKLFLWSFYLFDKYPPRLHRKVSCSDQILHCCISRRGRTITYLPSLSA